MTYINSHNHLADLCPLNKQKCGIQFSENPVFFKKVSNHYGSCVCQICCSVYAQYAQMALEARNNKAIKL